MEQTTIHMLHHTHWDREWYQPFEAMQIRLRDALRHVVDLVERGVIDCFYLDGQTSVLDDYRRIVTDEEYQRLCALIRAGKIEVGPWFVLADEFLCPAEAVIQNLRIGRFMAGELGSFCGMGYLPDTFGHIGSMPMVLRQFGIDKAIIWRGADPEHCEVNWASADGSAVKTLVLSTRDGYFQVGLKNPDYKEHLQRFVEFHRTKKKAGLLVYTDGADHTVCSADGMDRVRSFEAGSGVKVEQVTMERLCRLLDGCPAEETIEGELRDNRKIFVLSGTWSTRTYLKRMNQIIAARLVHELEFLCAWEQNASRSEALRRRLWKDFLVNQAHDSICGCSVDEVHREMMSRYARIAQSIGEQTESVLERQYPFVYGEPGAKNHWLHVINSLPYPGRRLVKARVLLPLDQDKGGIALWQGERPVLLSRAERRVQEEFFHNSLTQPWYEDMAVYELEFFLDFAGMEEICLRIEPTGPQETAAGQECPAENRFYWLEIRDGQLCVLEKSTGTWHTGQNVYRSSLDAGDTYNYSPPEQDACAEASVVAWRTESRPGQRTLYTESVMELPEGLAPDRKGPAQHTVTLTIYTEYTLYEDDPVIRVRTRLNNQARDHRLTADFAVPGCERHWSDTAFDWVERPVNDPVDPQVGPGQEVIPGQHPTGTQLVAGELQLVHLGLHEYQVCRTEHGERCMLTLLRCVGDLSRRDLRSRGGGAGPGYPTPEAQCQGEGQFEYGLIYGRSNHSPVHPLALRAPVFARQSTAESTGRLLLSLAGPVQFSGLEYEDGGYLLRLYNPLMQPQQVPLHTGFAACVRPEDLAANPAGEEQQGTRTLLTVGGRQLASYRIRPI